MELKKQLRQRRQIYAPKNVIQTNKCNAFNFNYFWLYYIIKNSRLFWHIFWNCLNQFLFFKILYTTSKWQANNKILLSVTLRYPPTLALPDGFISFPFQKFRIKSIKEKVTLNDTTSDKGVLTVPPNTSEVKRTTTMEPLPVHQPESPQPPPGFLQLMLQLQPFFNLSHQFESETRMEQTEKMNGNKLFFMIFYGNFTF